MLRAALLGDSHILRGCENVTRTMSCDWHVNIMLVEAYHKLPQTTFIMLEYFSHHQLHPAQKIRKDDMKIWKQNKKINFTKMKLSRTHFRVPYSGYEPFTRKQSQEGDGSSEDNMR